MNVSCPVCHTTTTRLVRDYRSNLPHAEGVFAQHQIFVCDTCGVGFIQPMPSDETLKAYYKQYYRNEHSRHILSNSLKSFFMARARAQLAWVISRLPEQTITSWMDIGAGYGFLLDEVARKYTADLAAVEVEPAACKRLQQVGYTIYKDAGDTVRCYQVISFSHLLEHITRPHDFLSTVHAHLEDDGVVFCEVPHILDVMLPENDAPHALFFNEISLRRLFELNNFEVIASGGFGDSWGKEKSRLALLTQGLRVLLPSPPLAIDRIMNQRVYAENPTGIYLRVLARKRG